MKKVLKTIIIIFLIIIFVGVIFFVIDFNKVIKNERPIFCIPYKDVNDGGTVIYLGIGYKVIDYNIINGYDEIEIGNLFMKYDASKVKDVQDKITTENKDIVIIKNSEFFENNASVENIKLIDDFIEKTSNSRRKILEEISLEIHEYNTKETYNIVKIIYTPGILNNKENEDTIICVSGEGEEFYKEQFGYYTVIINNDENTKKEYNAFQWSIKRKTVDNKVNIILDVIPFIELEEDVVLCSFDLSQSGYNKIVNLNYYQRKDMGIEKIIDKDKSEFDINVYTFGGEVSVLVDTDMVYFLKDALEQKVITIEDILNQAKLDTKYGICEAGAYSDGGSIEYMYPEYTILKYDNLDGKKDLVIGFKGQIINKFDDELEKTKYAK